jgi:hypothetical protein
VLRRIFGPKRDEVTEGWKKLHNNELHNLCSSPSIISNDQVKGDEMGRAYSMNWGKSNAYWILVGKPEGKRPLGRPRRKRMDINKMNHREICNCPVYLL